MYSRWINRDYFTNHRADVNVTVNAETYSTIHGSMDQTINDRTFTYKATFNYIDFDAKHDRISPATGQKILTEDRAGKDGKTLFYLMMWQPKGKKPFVNCYFDSMDQRERYIEDALMNFNAWRREKAARKEANKPTPELMQKVKVGSIFCWSWGYEQTNVEFYEITAMRGVMATVRPIASKTVEGSEYSHGMADNVVPVPGAFLAGDQLNPQKESKKIQFSNGNPYLAKPYGWCSLWEGKAHYRSWYA